MVGLFEKGVLAQRETLAPEAALPPEMTAPYHPGELSKRYWALSAGERASINAMTDTDFKSRSGIGRKLDRRRAEDLPAVRMWLRIRDEQVAQMPPAEAAATGTVPPTTGTAPAKAVAPEEIEKLIAKHQTLKTLDEAGLAKDLAASLPGDPAFVTAVIKALYWWHQRDATSVEVCKLLGDADLAGIASDSAGRELLLLMVSEMQGVHTSADDKKQAQRVMRAISKSTIAKGGRVEIEVLTFRRGFAALD